jgi:CheY-like chemotaxis protein
MITLPRRGLYSANQGLILGPGGARPRVLFAEDSPVARTLTAALLKRIGCEVEAVEDGEMAFGRARETAYDLIVLDIEMPVMDGLTAARKIRELEGGNDHTPLMAFSAFLADLGSANRWNGLFDVALAKPAGRDELSDAILRALGC